MARIKYLGPVDPLRIPGIGPVDKDWKPCPDEIAREFKGVDGFQVEFDKSPSPPPLSPQGRGKKGGGALSSGGDKS